MTAVNTETGEITEPGTDLAPIDRTAVSVVTTLEHAKRWLSTAVEMTGPEEIAAAKAHIRTAETYARELNLSKEIQLDAQEMVRRAEYALGKSIRKGQAEGTITKVGSRPNGTKPHERDRYGRHESLQGGVPNTNASISPKDFIPHGSELHETYALADAEQEGFDAALSEAKAEGNLSRANVVRKVKKQASPGGKSRAEKADLLEELAAQGFSSRQMCKQLGFSRDDAVRDLAREYGIEIPADKAITRTRRINSTDVVVNTATALEGLVMGVGLIEYEDVDPEVASQWADSLTESMRTLNRFVKKIKETTHD